MDGDRKYYRHSGTVGAFGLVLIIAFGLVGTLILAGLYGYGIFYIPYIYIKFALTMFYGAGIGYLIGSAGKWGQVRNSGAILLFGCLFGVFGVFAGWISWIFAASEQQVLALLPGDILGVMRGLAEEGPWSIFGWAPTGASLYAIWGIEALLIVGCSSAMGWSLLSSKPFCELCKQWIESRHKIGPLSLIENPDDLRQQLEDGNLEMLKALTLLDVATSAYTKIELLHCPGCGQNDYLTIQAVTVALDSRNNENKTTTAIVENLIITPEQIRLLKDHWETNPPVPA